MSNAHDSFAAAIAKWPNVPACHGWLSLDRRGGWRLQGEAVTHGGLRVFLDQGYRRDDDGAWFVQNGPQKVFVSLDYMPLILRLATDGSLSTHTGQPAGDLEQAWFDEDGNLLLATHAGPGLLDDRDLATALSSCTTPAGEPARDDDLLAALNGETTVCWRGLRVGTMKRADAPARFGFIADPQPDPVTPPAESAP